jgi:hypothetical protein
MRTSKAGLMIVAFGLFLMLCPTAVFGLYIPQNFAVLFLHPLTLALFAFGAVFLSLGVYFRVIGKFQA